MSTTRITHLRRRIALSGASALVAATICGACSSPQKPSLSGQPIPPSGHGSAAPAVVTDTPAAIATDIAGRIGCSDVQENVHVETGAAFELSCLLDGDNNVIVFAFSDTAHEDSWFAGGMQSADDSGTVVLGPGWAAEPYTTAQAAQIQQAVGGTIERQQA